MSDSGDELLAGERVDRARRTGLGEGYRALVDAALAVDTEEWIAETRSIDEWYATIGGNRLPEVLREQLAALKLRLVGNR